MNVVARWTESLRERLRRPQLPLDAESHLRAAVDWLFRAQDAASDRGMPHGYLIGKGWMRSTPEATGCVIPTLLNWGQTARVAEAKDRALEMADWLLSTQLAGGDVPGRAGTPAAFDTGQAIFGWLGAHRESGKSLYLEAAKRAGDWLIGALDDDGRWCSQAGSGGVGRVSDVRVAWALLELARVSGDDRYAAPMPRFLTWALEQEKDEEGWFDGKVLGVAGAPILQGIAYTAQGLLESGMLLGYPEYIAAAERIAHSLVQHAGSDGRMPGSFQRGWQPAVDWASLAGMAQMSVVWQRLQAMEEVVVEEDEGLRLLMAANRVNVFLMRTQDCVSRNGALRGGIRGSFPVSRDHARWLVSTWSTKVFIDALMEEVPRAKLPYRY